MELRAQTPEQRAEVVRLALEHLGRRPWSREATLAAARGLSGLDHPDLAEPYFRRAGPLNLADSHVRAMAILRANRREEAMAAYQEIARRWPEDPEAVRKLGALALTMSDYDEALRWAQRLAELPGSEAEGHRLAAVAHHESGYPESAFEAVAASERLLAIDPSLASVPEDARVFFWFRYGTDLIGIGRAVDAVQVLERVLPRHDDPVLRIVQGQAAANLGDLDRAEDELRRATTAAPELATGWLELGRLELRRGRASEAVEVLRRAEALEPSNGDVLYSLKLAYRRAGREAEAEAADQRLEMLRRRRPPPARGMGAGRPATMAPAIGGPP